MSKRLVIDVETTIRNKGNPFTASNQLVVTGVLDVDSGEVTTYWYGKRLDDLQKKIDSATLIIGFNFKFDMHWLRRIGIIFPSTVRVWDCQLGEFILENQQIRYPSLNEASDKYGLGQKIDLIALNYWDKGIDTTEIPEDLLEEYLIQDLVLTKEVYLKQDKQFTGNLRKLFGLHCQDLVVLEDMEWNGLKFNREKAEQLAAIEEEKVREIEQQLRKGYETIPINFDSGDHLSAYLYGGTIVETVRIPIGVYKSGAKIGQPRYKLTEFTHSLPRLIDPIKGSELKKDGYYATNEPTLRSLKATGDVAKRIQLLLDRAKSEKLCSTYYRGLPKLIEEMDWTDGMLHGQFNQCVATTGRLSSTKPNMQNFAGVVKLILETRFD